jgi:hypothetical protein
VSDDEFQKFLNSLPNAVSAPEYQEALDDLFSTAGREQRKILLELARQVPPGSRLTAERRLARALRQAVANRVDGESFLDTRELKRMCTGLEYFLPRILAELYPHWQRESFDGFYFAEARRTGPLQGEFYGMAILISDQTITPIDVEIRALDSEEQIAWVKCRVGQRGTGKGSMTRIPWERRRANELCDLPEDRDSVDWVYVLDYKRPTRQD